ncbi:hypothetical protein EYC59_06575 [Candidatus Saccharibacteria bacterium]|nr:MAG: hypothetical protein EYC59_06575 [Candidatus Saccharibacteria bacterium]
MIEATDLRPESIQTPGLLSQEFIQAREQCWVKPEGPVWGGCGDDRHPTEISATALATANPNIMRADEAYASIYGGAAGMAKNVIITGVAQYGPGFIEQIGGFEGAFARVVSYLNEDESPQAIKPILHSAEGNENEDGTFCTHGDAATGCAYCGGVGAISALLVDEASATIRNAARAEQRLVFGTDTYTGELLMAHRTFLANATEGQGASFAVDRAAYIKQVEQGMPVMILAGKHVAADTGGVISNFELGVVGSAERAALDGMDFYRQDIAPITAAIVRNFRRHRVELDPEILMRSFQLDSTPVRAVLASHDANPALQGVLEPTNLGMGFRGDPTDAIEQIRHAI